jgi:hypothetical protein
MSSTVLVFDLIGRNAALKGKGNPRDFIQPEFDDCEEPVGLVTGEES